MTGRLVGRRRFLAGATALTTAVAAGCPGSAESDDPEPATTTGLPEGVVAIGEGYVTAFPEVTELELMEQLGAGVDDGADPGARLAASAEAIAADFAADRVVRVNGWWLSETEARICALGVLQA